MGTKRKLLYGWLAFELLGLIIALLFGRQATAQIVDHIMFKAVPRAAHVVTQIGPGESEILVASNAPFVILSSGAIGEIHLSLSVRGQINGVSYGNKAQMPGAVTTCILPLSTAPARLYLAKRKTAANRGAVIGQAVKFTLKYDPVLKPEFQVKTLDQAEAKNARPAPKCKPDIG